MHDQTIKILIAAHSLSAGGTERVVTNLANAWAADRRAVTVVTNAPLEQDHYPLHQNVRRIALGFEQPSKTAFSGALNNLRRIFAMRRVLRNECPDIAIAMMAAPTCIVRLAAIGTKVAVIGSERIHPPALPLGAIWERMRRWLYPGLSALIAQTERSASWLRKETGAANVIVIPNPIIHPLPGGKSGRLPPALDKPAILAVGRLDSQKGFDLLIEGFGKIAGLQPEWHLYIVGEGPARKFLEDKIAALALTERVHLTGTVDNPEDWYQAAEIFAMSSRFEGFPNVLLEAMAYGLAVVSFDCETGPAEVIENGFDGLLLPAEDTQALADALAKLITDKPLRTELGARATLKAQQYSMPKIAARWDDVFDELLKPST